MATELPPANVNIPQVGLPTGISDSKNVKEVVVYPNPASDVLRIPFSGEIQSIRLLSLNGQVLKIDEGSIVDKQINIESLVPGVYFLWVESAGQWYPTRFIRI